MKIVNFFMPTQMPEGITERERIQMPYLIITVLFLMTLFALFALVEVVLGAMLEAVMLAASTFAFAFTLYLTKKGNVRGATVSALIGLIFGQLVITFVLSIGGNPYGLYRIVAFVILMGITNFLISTRLVDILVYFAMSLVIWIVGAFYAYPQITADLTGVYIATSVVGIIGLIFEAGIAVLIFKMFGSLVSNIATEKEHVQTTLHKITSVLSESQQKLEVGNNLSKITASASTDVSKMAETFNMLKGDAEQLAQTVNMMLKSNTSVEQRSEGMRASTQSQNAAITESSVALTEISANLSNISEIATQRRKQMNALLEVLKGQKGLVQQALLEVKRVKESSNGIGVFIHTVEDIANQTGLLAMNASIEAAHAGTSGKGFAVIAQEIRKLSEETAKNAAHIGDALKTNEQTVDIATNSVVTFASQTEHSTGELQTTLATIEEILMGISEMDIGTREVMNSMQNIVENSQKNGALVDEVSEKIAEQSKSVSEISGFAKKLQQEIERSNLQLGNIQSALENIEDTAMQNRDVSSSMNNALAKIGM